VAGTTTLVTVAPNGGGAGYDQFATRDAEFSPDNRFLLFTNNGLLATPVTTPFNFTGATNLFAFDLGSHTQNLLSINLPGDAPANGGVESFSFIANPAGGSVLFISTASDMVAGVTDAPFSPDVFLAPLPAPGTATTSTTLTQTTSTTATSTTLPPCTTPRCTLDAARAHPLCAGQAVPSAVGKQLDRAVTLIDQAASGPQKRARKLLKQAKAALKLAAKKAARAARGQKAKLSSDCARTLGEAAQGVQGGLGL
jgi:hypothetical protein